MSANNYIMIEEISKNFYRAEERTRDSPPSEYDTFIHAGSLRSTIEKSITYAKKHDVEYGIWFLLRSKNFYETKKIKKPIELGKLSECCNSLIAEKKNYLTPTK